MSELGAGRAVVELLKAEQVRYIFGIVGSRLAHFTTHFDDRYIKPGTAIVQVGVDSCDIGNPRYDHYTRLFGADGYYVEHPDQIGDVVRAALGSSKPAVIEIPIDPEEFPIPATGVRRAAGRKGS